MRHRRHPKPQRVYPKPLASFRPHDRTPQMRFGFVLTWSAEAETLADFPLWLRLLATLVPEAKILAADSPVQPLHRRRAVASVGVVTAWPAAVAVLRPAVFRLAGR